MKKNLILMLLVGIMVGTMLTGCGSKEVETVETVEQTTVVSTVVDEAVEEIEKIEGTQKLDEAETAETVEETTEEVTEEATEQVTEVAETAEEATEVTKTAEEVAETTTTDAFAGYTIYASAGEAPTSGYLKPDNTLISTDCSGITTSVSDSGDGTYMYTLKGTVKFEGATSTSQYVECGMCAFDKATGKKIDNASNSGGSASIPEVGTFEFTYFATTNEKYDVVWCLFPTDGKDYSENITNVSELEAPDIVFFY